MPAFLQLLPAHRHPGKFEVWAALEPSLPVAGHPARLPGAALTTLLIAIVATVIVTITVPQAPDAVAVLAGELVLLTLPGG